MGMTYEQYWEQSPFLAVAYRKAHRLKRRAENERAWLHGLYVFDALSASLANATSPRGAKKQTYIERPIDFLPLTEREKKRMEAEENAKMQKAMEAMVRRQRQRKKQKGD